MPDSPKTTPWLRVAPEGTTPDDPEITGAIAQVESRSGGEVYLRLRADLEAESGGPGKVRVRRRDSTRSFTLYDMEWQLAQLMDGTRTIPQIAAAIAGQGIGATPVGVRSFARELKGYGFLEDDASRRQDHKLTANDPPLEEASGEVSQLLSTAMALRARGDLEQARNYLLAVLEIDPSNNSVKDLLMRVEADAPQAPRTTSASAPAPEESHVTRRPSQEIYRPEPTRRSLAPWMIGLALAATAGTVASAVALAPRLFEGHPKETTPPTPPPEAIRPPTDSVQLAPGSVVQVRTAIAGVVSELLVSAGDSVSPGTPVAVVMGKPGYAKVSQLKTKVERLKAQSQKDTVSLFQLDDAQHKLDTALHTVRTAKTLAQQAGAVGRIVAPVGTNVGAGDVLLELADLSEMTASLPLQRLPAAPDKSRCEVVTQGTASSHGCRIGEVTRDALGQQVVRLRVDNPRQELKSGQWVDVRLLASPP